MAEFKEELAAAAQAYADKEQKSTAHLLRMAFFAGVDWEMERRRRETQNARKAAKDDRAPY